MISGCKQKVCKCLSSVRAQRSVLRHEHGKFNGFCLFYNWTRPQAQQDTFDVRHETICQTYKHLTIPNIGLLLLLMFLS
jgi:hypothetical protein